MGEDCGWCMACGAGVGGLCAPVPGGNGNKIKTLSEIGSSFFF